ncbi:hypothetical protein BDN70DRAFT_375709 [Pholiota conissans]|uniref:Uncharacterized protein n=1 Tax=Pholiota conissans TaxID=109636 RepID=A0A9P6CU33_9AGAR|nr:hypothetical protein BDN70DRAFT_375709 [Pholiota conissans]
MRRVYAFAPLRRRWTGCGDSSKLQSTRPTSMHAPNSRPSCPLSVVFKRPSTSYAHLLAYDVLCSGVYRGSTHACPSTSRCLLVPSMHTSTKTHIFILNNSFVCVVRTLRVMHSIPPRGHSCPPLLPLPTRIRSLRGSSIANSLLCH